jgi:hypothetical protein
LVERFAKEAAVEDGTVVYDKIAREEFMMREMKSGINMWQQQWTNTAKGTVTKAFSVSEE